MDSPLVAKKLGVDDEMNIDENRYLPRSPASIMGRLEQKSRMERKLIMSGEHTL